jgi:polyferredoxin
MSSEDKRLRTLYAILRKRGAVHRYTWIRWGVGVVATVLVALLPLTDTLRLDLWAGRHRVLGEPADLQAAANAFAFPFLAVNVLIILVSRFFGRYLCGFVCPIGTLARLVEWARFRGRRGNVHWRGPSVALTVCVVLAAVTFSFWVDWGVFREGSAFARVVAGTLFAGLALGPFVVIQFMGLRFCRDWCPSGVYFAVLGHETANGVEFANPDACTECGVCDVVCPMDLEPRKMSGGEHRPGSGFYGDGLSNFALCVRCGDCIVGCEEVGQRGTPVSALRMGPLPPGARESRVVAAPEPEAVAEDKEGAA